MPLSDLLLKKTPHRLRPDTWTEHRFAFDAVSRELTQRDSAGRVELRTTVEGAADVQERAGKKSHRFDLELGGGSSDACVPSLWLALSAPDAATKASWLGAVRSAEAVSYTHLTLPTICSV